jgi:hypothetical protein
MDLLAAKEEIRAEVERIIINRPTRKKGDIL